MNQLKSIFRSPVALGGLIAAAIVFSVAAAAIVTGGFSSAQETPEATDEPAATDTPNTDDSTDEPSTDKSELRGEFLDRLATELGVSREQLDQALENVSLDLVDEAVADGRITESEAERIREAIENGKIPFFGVGPFHHRFHFPLVQLDEIAEFLGIEPADIRSGLEEGQSLAQIAEANGKSRDELKAFLVNEVNEYVDQALENDRITEERAAEIRENAAARIDELIDHEGLPLRGPRWRFGKDGSDLPLPEGMLDEGLELVGPLL
jgi:hypothetical protein